MKNNTITFLNLLKENTGIKVGDEVYYAAEELQSVVSKVVGDKVEIEDAEGEKMMVSMSAVKKIGNGREVQQQEAKKGFTDNRKKIDLAEPKGKITAADFKKLRAKKNEATDWRYSVKTKPVDVMSLRSGDDIDGVGTVTRVAKDEEGRYHVFVTDSFGREKEYRNGFSPFNKVNVITTYSKSTGPRSPRITEGGDHEVSMAMTSLKEIVEAAQELMLKLGDQERNIPGWIQNHITNAQNYIVQASQGFHELHGEEGDDEAMSLTSMMESIKKQKTKRSN